MRDFIRERFPEFEATARADEELSGAQLAERRMAERDALLAKIGSGVMGSDVPQIEFVKQNIVDKALNARPDGRPPINTAAATVTDEPALWFEVSEIERARAKANKERADQLKRIAEEEAELAKRDAEQAQIELQFLQQRREEQLQKQQQQQQDQQQAQPEAQQVEKPRATFKQPLSRQKRAVDNNNNDDDERADSDERASTQSVPRATRKASPLDAVIKLLESGDVGKLSIALGAFTVAVLLVLALIVFVWRVVLAEAVLFPVLLLATLGLVALLASQFAAHRQGNSEQRFVAESVLALRAATGLSALLFVRSVRLYALAVAVALAVGVFVHAQSKPAVPLGTDPVAFGSVIVALVALVFQLVAGGGRADATLAPQQAAPTTPVKEVRSRPASPQESVISPKAEPDTGLKKRGGNNSSPLKADFEDAHESQTAQSHDKKHK
jgi:hypothetical protein